MSDYFFNPPMETLTRAELTALQEERLRWQVSRCYEQVPFYTATFDRLGLRPSAIRTIRDLQRLPFTEKSDLRQAGPYGLLAVPRERIHRFAASSGTTGLPALVGFTRADWEETLPDQMGRLFAMFGLGPGDLVYQGYGYGLFLGGPSVEVGTAAVGASLFPAGPGRTAAAVSWLRALGPAALSCTPTYAQYLLGYAERTGVEPRRDWPTLRAGLFGGEGAAPALRRNLLDRLPEGFRYCELYGSSELGGASVAGSCEHSGEYHELHLLADHYLAEIVDPATGEAVEPGAPGELVVTTLTREAVPLLRYRTRDITRLAPAPFDCACGRIAHPRLCRIEGRSDDMLKVRGTLIFPGQVEDVINLVSGMVAGWQIIVDAETDWLASLLVQCEATAEIWAVPDRRLGLAERLCSELSARLGLRPEVEICAPGSLPVYEGRKAARVVRAARESAGGETR